MKKVSYIILGGIIGALVTYYFCPRTIDKNITSSSEKNDNPTGVITILKAEELSANWETHNVTGIDSALEIERSKKVTRSVMWTLKDIEDYLVYAKRESDLVGYTMTGVRVYLGNYGSEKKGKKRNKNTMFIVPTGHKNISKASSVLNFIVNEQENIPVDPLNNGTGGDTGYP